jgi:putative phosphoribosyl transferase
MLPMNTITEAAIPIADGQDHIAATVAIPANAGSVIVFAHGSGSSRHSPRNQMVAEHLNEHGHATVLLDLLTLDEELTDTRTGQWRFDIPLLARRLVDACDWLATQPVLRELPIGLFGASTGAAAALIAAAERPDRIQAVVSRGGRPDLADTALTGVRAPTLLIVGGEDDTVIGLNREAAERLSDHRLILVPGASHLFTEPGALQQVTQLAHDWFDWHLHPVQVTGR